jgi:hypothetical protein
VGGSGPYWPPWVRRLIRVNEDPITFCNQLLNFFVIVRKSRTGPFYHTLDPIVSSPFRSVGPVVGDESR